MRIVYTLHLNKRLKERDFPQNFPRKIFYKPDFKFKDTFSGRLISMKKREVYFKMKKTKKNKTAKEFYDKDSDIKWFVFKDGEEAYYREIAPGVNIEFDKSGDVIGAEILDFTKQPLVVYNYKSDNSGVYPPIVETEVSKTGNYLGRLTL